jgi:hypothetical protein
MDNLYIQECLNFFQNLNKIFIFTDDKDWAKENFKDDKYSIVEGIHDYEELWMMSLCPNMIISPSTFSWWSAFLNKSEDRKVISPNIWFGPEGFHPHNNIFEKNWVKIDVEIKNGFFSPKK